MTMFEKLALFSALTVVVLQLHRIADFLFQTSGMNGMKTKPQWPGARACCIHVGVYTLIVAPAIVFAVLVVPRASVGVFDLLAIVAAVAVPHWLIDRYDISTWWMRNLNGRELYPPKTMVNEDERALFIARSVSLRLNVDQIMHRACLVAVVALVVYVTTHA